MATDKMYELAYKFKNIKLWQILREDEVFAVRLSDGETGYCSVTGFSGGYYSLRLNIGDEGYRRFRLLLDSEFMAEDEKAIGYLLMAQNCLLCSFENKDMLEEELQEVLTYARSHDKPTRGKNNFPQFTKFRPGRYPWRLDSKLDCQRICEALSAAIALKPILRKYAKDDLGLCSLFEEPGKIPMLAYEGARWVIKYKVLPSPAMVYPAPELTNEVLAARLKRMKKNGTWECGTIGIPTPVENEDPNEAPFIPLALIYVNPASEYIYPPIIVEGQDNSSEMMNNFAMDLSRRNHLPQKIRCSDDRCFSLIKDLCSKAGIKLERTDNTVLLENVMQDLFYKMAYEDEDEDSSNDELDELDELISNLYNISDVELLNAPREITDMLIDIADEGVLPADLARRVKRLFRKKT